MSMCEALPEIWVSEITLRLVENEAVEAEEPTDCVVSMYTRFHG